MAFFAAIVGGVGIYNIRAMDKADTKLYEKFTVPIGQLQEMISSYFLIRLALQELQYETDGVKKQEEVNRACELLNTIDQDAIEFDKTILTKEGREHFREFTDVWKLYKVDLVEAIRMGDQGNRKGLALLQSGVMAQNGARAFEVLVEQVSSKIRQAKRSSEENNVLSKNATVLMCLFTMMAILLGVCLGGIITRGIRRQLGGEPADVAELAGKVARGDLSTIIDTTGKDPQSIIVAMQRMTEAIRALVADAGTLTQAAMAGNLDTRADATKHRGDFRDLVVGINNIVNNIVKPLRVTTALLNEEVAQRRIDQELLQDHQLQLESLNLQLEERVADEVLKNRELDRVLMQSEKMASIGQLAAGVAHEINNPMGFISSNLRTLADYLGLIIKYDRIRQGYDDRELTEGSRILLANCRNSLDIDTIFADGTDLIEESLVGAQRVTKIVLDLKNFSRVDAPDYELTTLDACLESALTICFNELKYVATIRKMYEPLPVILCHPGQLNQVFLNLLINAGQAIVTPPGEITLKCWHDGDSVYASVSDTGQGISDEIRSQIFNPFFTTKDVGKGTGLGLSISYEIIKRQQGEILVESASGQGTTFTVRLPRTTKI